MKGEFKMEQYFEVIYKYSNFDKSFCRFIPGLKNVMEHELMLVYNIYANMCNDGVTENLNKEFDNLYPTYFEENKGKDVWDLIEYNQFMRDGWQERVVNDINDIRGNIMNYRLGDELQLIGSLKVDPKVEIEFYMKEA